MDAVYLDGIIAHLKARAKAMSGDTDDDVDWDETYGTD